jgi:carbamoyl-phosphate synthase large subunit
MRLLLQVMTKIGLDMANSDCQQHVRHVTSRLCYWHFIIIRPAFTCGGTGGGISGNQAEFEQIVMRALDASMTSQVRCLR